MNKSLIALSLSLLIFPTISFAKNDTKITSGVYEQITLTTTPDNEIVGYYSEESASASNVSCNFSFSGKYNSASRVFDISTDDSIKGKIQKSPYGITLTLNDIDAGCQMLIPPTIKSEGIEFSLVSKKDWINLLVISSDKVYLGKEPKESNKTKIYIIKNDKVGLIKSEGNYSYIEYINQNNKSFKGWIKNSDFSYLNK